MFVMTDTSQKYYKPRIRINKHRNVAPAWAGTGPWRQLRLALAGPGPLVWAPGRAEAGLDTTCKWDIGIRILKIDMIGDTELVSCIIDDCSRY